MSHNQRQQQLIRDAQNNKTFSAPKTQQERHDQNVAKQYLANQNKK